MVFFKNLTSLVAIFLTNKINENLKADSKIVLDTFYFMSEELLCWESNPNGKPKFQEVFFILETKSFRHLRQMICYSNYRKEKRKFCW